MDHPFWRARFLLKDPKDLARIQATAIQEIWIGTDKRPGCCGGHRIHVPRGGGCADRDRLQPPGRTAPGLGQAAIAPRPPKRDRKPADMRSELKMAAAICAKSY